MAIFCCLLFEMTEFCHKDRLKYPCFRWYFIAEEEGVRQIVASKKQEQKGSSFCEKRETN